MERATLLAALIVTIVITGIVVYAYYHRHSPNTAAGQTGAPHENPTITPANLLGSPFNGVLSVPLSPGEKIQLNSTIIMTVGNITQNHTVTINITINNISWPFVNVTLEGSQNNQPQILPVTFLAIPQQFLSKNKIIIPISIPIMKEGLCMNLSLINKSQNTYTYKGIVSLYGYKTIVLIKSYFNGFIYYEKYIITNNKTENSSNYLYFENYIYISKIINKNKIYNINVSNWLCEPPFSSHLWFTWEGVYRLSGCRLKPASLEDLHHSIQNKSVVIILNKGCPHCIRTWPNLTEALSKTCNNIKTPLYIIIIGGFLDKQSANYIQYLMTSNGLNGVPAFVYFKGGYAADKMMGERLTEQIIIFLENHSK